MLNHHLHTASYAFAMATIDRIFANEIDDLLLELQKTRLPIKSDISINSQTKSGNHQSARKDTQDNLQQSIINSHVADGEPVSVDEALYAGSGSKVILQVNNSVQTSEQIRESSSDNLVNDIILDNDEIRDENISIKSSNLFETSDVFETLIGKILGDSGFSVSGTNGATRYDL